MTRRVDCDYCGRPATLTTGRELYGQSGSRGRRLYWRCDPCDAHVGCHPGSDGPLGSLAKKAVREARIRAHNAFELLIECGLTRRDAYTWLRNQMGLDERACHIGRFDVERCRRVVNICSAYKSRHAQSRRQDDGLTT